jgi:16S rRNA (guanine527-N7)-methyltransferase
MLEYLVKGCQILGLELTPCQLNQFELYYKELIDWNTKTNLTAITDYHDVQIKHFLDSLSVYLAFHNMSVSSLKMLDVGTGAGFPGIPIKIVFPDINLTLLEATGKKVSYLKHIVSKLNLVDTDIITARAEDLAHESYHREQYNIVTARALAELPVLLELTLPFCRIGGKVISQKKGDIKLEIEHMQRALDLLGGELSEVITVTIPGLLDERSLVIINKIRDTPFEYPRRSGMPYKYPILS